MEKEPPAVRVLSATRAAGVSGVVAALLLGGAMVLVRLAVPEHPADAETWLSDSANVTALKVALILLPFGAIAFLWFMGAVRDFVGEREDQFFATVFLGSGLLYVAMMLVFGAVAGAFVLTVDRVQDPSHLTGFGHFGRYLTFSLLTESAPRMAGVFTLTSTTIGTRLGLMPRWLTVLGYLAGLVLLLVVRSVAWAELVFPCWVLVVGVFIITRRLREMI